MKALYFLSGILSALSGALLLGLIRAANDARRLEPWRDAVRRLPEW